MKLDSLPAKNSQQPTTSSQHLSPIMTQTNPPTPPPEDPTTEKRNPVDQPAADRETRFDRARTFILANPRLFATQGSVVANWRVRAGKRFGPYYRLAFRRNGRQRSIYLGPLQVADLLRDFLAKLQRPHRRHRLYKSLQAQVRASLRTAKTRLAQQLAALGITLKGYEFRGAARALSPYGPLAKPRSTIDNGPPLPPEPPGTETANDCRGSLREPNVLFAERTTTMRR